MKIIISPAKKMKIDNDCLLPKQMPVFLEKAETLKTYLQNLSYNDLKELLQCNDKIVQLNFDRYQQMDLQRNLTPAILAYEGIQYQYMAPQVFEDDYFSYVEEHLRILSGFYGILRPFDGVVPYRLEMQAKLKTDFGKNLYDFWQDAIYQQLTKEQDIILNLASAEYSKVITKYLGKNVSMVTCIFGELLNEKIIEKGVYVKMARGEMVRFMAENQIKQIEDIKCFHGLDFSFQEELSSSNQFIFLKNQH